MMLAADFKSRRTLMDNIFIADDRHACVDMLSENPKHRTSKHRLGFGRGCTILYNATCGSASCEARITKVHYRNTVFVGMVNATIGKHRSGAFSYVDSGHFRAARTHFEAITPS